MNIMDKIIIATDVDGTLTDRKRRLNLAAIRILRRLQGRGIEIILVSSHAFPAMSSLADYLGFRYIVAETGGCGGFPWKPWFVEKLPNSEKIVKIATDLGFRPTPSNSFRLADISLFPPPRNVDDSLDELRKALRSFNVTIYYSGFAVHIVKENVNKGTGLKKLLEITGLDGKIIAIGDGLNDIPLFEASDISITAEDSPETLRKTADIVLPFKGVQATVFLLKNIEHFFILRKLKLEKLKKTLVE